MSEAGTILGLLEVMAFTIGFKSLFNSESRESAYVVKGLGNGLEVVFTIRVGHDDRERLLVGFLKHLDLDVAKRRNDLSRDDETLFRSDGGNLEGGKRRTGHTLWLQVLGLTSKERERGE